MITNPRNSDIELYKKKQRTLIIERVKDLKKNFPKQYMLEVGLVKQKNIEEENRVKWAEFKKKFDLNESTVKNHGSIRSSSETPTSLAGFRELQEKAKQLMENRRSQDDDFLKTSKSPTNFPIIIPQSIYRKSQRYPPPVIQKITNTGESLAVHLLSDSCKINDPMVKVFANIDQRKFLTPSQEILSGFNNRSSSLPPPLESNGNIRYSPTPRGKAEFYSFRDLGFDHIVTRNPRTWVKERIDQYSHKVKSDFIPKISLKKKLEMILLREKEKEKGKKGMIRVKKIKLLSS